MHDDAVPAAFAFQFDLIRSELAIVDDRELDRAGWYVVKINFAGFTPDKTGGRAVRPEGRVHVNSGHIGCSPECERALDSECPPGGVDHLPANIEFVPGGPARIRNVVIKPAQAVLPKSEVGLRVGSRLAIGKLPDVGKGANYQIVFVLILPVVIKQEKIVVVDVAA